MLKCVEVLNRNIDAQARLVDGLLDVNCAALDKLSIEKHALQIDSVVSAEVQSQVPFAQRKQIDPRYRVDADATLTLPLKRLGAKGLNGENDVPEISSFQNGVP